MRAVHLTYMYRIFNTLAGNIKYYIDCFIDPLQKPAYQETPYICETTLIYTTFAFDSVFRVLAVFPKMKGFYKMAETMNVY